MKPKQRKLYPIVDLPDFIERNKLGFDHNFLKVLHSRSACRVVKTGQFRKPKKGEWYLSGAIPEGYKAKNNLTTKYHICRLVRVKTEHVVVETIVKEFK